MFQRKPIKIRLGWTKIRKDQAKLTHTDNNIKGTWRKITLFTKYSIFYLINKFQGNVFLIGIQSCYDGNYSVINNVNEK